MLMCAKSHQVDARCSLGWGESATFQHFLTNFTATTNTVLASLGEIGLADQLRRKCEKNVKYLKYRK